ncbi:MAG: TonB-dependent receptor [Acidobacteriota bacterium]
MLPRLVSPMRSAPQQGSSTRFARLFAAALCLAVVLTAPAVVAAENGTIEGQILGADGGAIAGANIEIVDLRAQTKSDEEGRFSFNDVRPGTYLLRVDGPVGDAVTERVTVTPGGTVDVPVTLTVVRYDDEVVISGSAIARSQLELAQPTTVLTGDELRFRQQTTLGETLSQEAGVSTTFFGQGASRPVIRGIGGDRVRMLQDGVDVGDVSASSPDHAVALETGLAERIEILRGPSTLLYGSNAVGGVVNVTNNRIPNSRAEKAIAGFLDISGGSAAEDTATAVSLKGGGGDWAWHVSGARRDGDNYEIPGFAELEGEHDEHGEEHDDEEHDDDGEEHDEDGEEHEEHEEEPSFGEVENTDYERESGTVGFTRFFGDKGFIGVSVSGFESQYGVPGEHAEHGEHGEEHDDDGEEHEEEEHEEEEHEEEGGIRLDLERVRYDLHGEITQPFGAFKGASLRIGVVDYEHSELEGEGEVGTTFFSDAVDARFEMVQKQRGSLNGSIGFQYINRELEAVGAEAFIPLNEAETLALFTFQEIERPDSNLRFQFGARFETQDNSNSVGLRERSFDGFSGSAGVVWEPTEGYAIAASLSRSTKLPNGEELYSFGPHFAVGAFEIGDPNLDEETSLGVDVSFRKTTGRLTGELNLYQNNFSDFIFQNFTGEEEDGLPVLVYSQADADFQGAELQARLGLWEDGLNHLDLTVTGDVVRAEFDAGGDLPRIPPHRIGVGLHYHATNWRSYVEYWDVAEQDRVAANEDPTEGYNLLNAGFSYRFLSGSQIYDVIFRGRNLTDEEARNHVSFVKNLAPLPGRNFNLALRWTF